LILNRSHKITTLKHANTAKITMSDRIGLVFYVRVVAGIHFTLVGTPNSVTSIAGYAAKSTRFK
jgi:hypothetical protein